MIEKLIPDPDFGFFDDNGVAWTSRANYLKQFVLPLCDCGDSDSVLKYIFDMFQLHVGESTWSTNDYNDMPVMFFFLGLPTKIILNMERLFVVRG